MNKTKYILIVAVTVLGLALWSSHSFAQDNTWVEGTVQGGYSGSSFGATELIGYRVYSPVYLGNLGQVTDLLIDRCDGRAAFVVLSDTPGFGSEFAVLPFGALERTGEHTFQARFGDVPIAYQGLDWRGDRFAKYMEMNRSLIGMESIPATIDPMWAELVYRVYGLRPFWTEGKSSHAEIVSYRMSGRTDELAIRYPDGGLNASYGAAPYWTTCSTCGAEAMNVKDVASAPMPSYAKAGECYARVFVAPQCKEVSDQVMTRPASERVEEIPAKYETVQERVMVSPASKKIEQIPAEYKTVEEQVLVEPAHTEWRPGRGAVEKMDQATGKIMCLVEIPAQYKTVSKQVLVKPATTREVEIPAQYEMRSVQKMVEPAHENHIQIPAEYKTVTKTEQVSGGYWEWQKVEGCHAE
jgi:hypothetical protein